MRKEEREHCAEILKQGVEIGVHDSTRLLNYTDALELAAIKMYRSVTGFRRLTEEDFAEIKEVMKMVLPPGEV